MFCLRGESISPLRFSRLGHLVHAVSRAGDWKPEAGSWKLHEPNHQVNGLGRGARLKFCPGSESQMKSKNYKLQILTLTLAALAISPALAQVASHEPTALPMVATSAAPAASATLSPVQ